MSVLCIFGEKMVFDFLLCIWKDLSGLTLDVSYLWALSK